MASVLVRAHQRQLLQVRNLTASRIGRLWDGLPDWRDPAPFVEQAIPIVESGQTLAVRLLDAYLARQVGISPLGLDPKTLIGTYVRNGASLEDIYSRPFRQLYGDLDKGKPFSQALFDARNRATETADMDVALANRDATVEWGRQAEASGKATVYGWERVPSEGACDFCELASTQVYRTDDLSELHDRCNCTSAALTEPPDGQVLDQEKLDRLREKGVVVYRGGGVKQQYGGTETSAAVTTAVHGERGPVLVDGRDNFRGPTEVMGGTSSDDWASWASGQGWNVTDQQAGRIEAERDGQTIAWERVTQESAATGNSSTFWRVARD